jgi:hypothetical protein
MTAIGIRSVNGQALKHHEHCQKIMRLPSILLSTTLLLIISLQAEEGNKQTLPKTEVQRLLDLIKTKPNAGPSIYGAIYYPKWRESLDGLKSITAEAIAENANRKLTGGIELTLVGEPIIDGDVAGVMLRRSEGALEEGMFPAYLYRDKKSAWGFLGFPIPFEAPALLGADGRFMARALNDPTPYDGTLYEFDAATVLKYEAIRKKLEAAVASKQPAAAAESKPQGPEKPKLETEPRSSE